MLHAITGTLMWTFDRLLTATIISLAILAGAILTSVAAVLVFNVASRLVAGRNVYGMVDGIELGIMAATFLAAPWVLMKNAHVRVDLVPRLLGERMRRALEIATDLLGAALSAVMCWAAGNSLMLSHARGSLVRGVLALPEWLLLIAPTAGAALLVAEFLRRVARGHTRDGAATGL